VTVEPVGATRYTITGAPRVLDGMCLSATAARSWGGARLSHCYDTTPENSAWRFYTVPGDRPHPFEKSDGEAAQGPGPERGGKVGGGGHGWASWPRPNACLLYVGGGNGSMCGQSLRMPQSRRRRHMFCRSSSFVALRSSRYGESVGITSPPGNVGFHGHADNMILATSWSPGKSFPEHCRRLERIFLYVLDRAARRFLSARAFTPVNCANERLIQDRSADRSGARLVMRDRQAVCFERARGRTMGGNDELQARLRVLLFSGHGSVPCIFPTKHFQTIVLDEYRCRLRSADVFGPACGGSRSRAVKAGIKVPCRMGSAANKDGWRRKRASFGNGGTLENAGKFVV